MLDTPAQYPSMLFTLRMVGPSHLSICEPWPPKFPASSACEIELQYSDNHHIAQYLDYHTLQESGKLLKYPGHYDGVRVPQPGLIDHLLRLDGDGGNWWACFYNKAGGFLLLDYWKDGSSQSTARMVFSLNDFLSFPNIFHAVLQLSRSYLGWPSGVNLRWKIMASGSQFSQIAAVAILGHALAWTVSGAADRKVTLTWAIGWCEEWTQDFHHDHLLYATLKDMCGALSD